MKRHKKYVSKLLSGVFSVAILLLVGTFWYQKQVAEQALSENFPRLLEETVQKYIEQKSKVSDYSALIKHNPDREKRIGEYETRTVQYSDTTFTYQSRIVEPETKLLKGFQTFFLEVGRLHADSIQMLFDEVLQANNIHAQSIIGITADSHKKLNVWSRDTTAMDIHLRAALTNQGLHEDINYYAYLHYSFFTLWGLMPKTAIGLFFLCSLLSGLLLRWWIARRRKERRNGIELLKDGNYRIKDILLDVEKRKLVSDEKGLELTAQPFKLLLLFLSAADHKVRKTALKQTLWPDTMNPSSNMTSAVNRLNKELKEINCAYMIKEDLADEEYYIFSGLNADFYILNAD
jgi:uncharacterized protein YneF (UPF0154 family)